MSDIHPFQYSPHDDKHKNEEKNESPYNGWQFLKDIVEIRKAQQAQVVEDEKECNHKGHYQVIGGNCIALRWCANCGQSWRMPTHGDYMDGQYPDALWEEITEPVEVPERVLPDYEG